MGLYTIRFNDGTNYVGRSFFMRARINSHFNRNGKLTKLGYRPTDVVRLTTKRGPRNLLALRRMEDKQIMRQWGRWGRTMSHNQRREMA